MSDVPPDVWEKFNELVVQLTAADWDAWFPVGLEHNGRRIAATLTSGRFGPTWALTDDRGKYTGVFLTNRVASLRKKGYRVIYEQARAHVELVGETRDVLTPIIVRDHDRYMGGFIVKPAD